jgi:hypothetical protein
MATASSPQRTPREVIDFPPNVPVTLALKYSQGKVISGQYEERVMFTTCDNRVLFLDPETAGKIEAAGINEQPNGTLVVPALPEPKGAQRAAAAVPNPSERLVDEANALVDAYAAVLQRALDTYQGRVKPDEVRSILLSAYIQRGKCHAA